MVLIQLKLNTQVVKKKIKKTFLKKSCKKYVKLKNNLVCTF